jgi:hypothetical protein
MKKVLTVSFFTCLFFIPVFSQAVRKNIKAYKTSIALVDARSFYVVNMDFSSSLDHIVNKRVLLVGETSAKSKDSYGMVRHSKGNQFYNSNSGIGTVKILPRSIQLQIPEMASRYMR